MSQPSSEPSTSTEQRLLRRFTTASYLCMACTLVCIVALGAWGAVRDLRSDAKFLIEAEISTLKSHAERTVGHIESQLLDGSIGPDFSGLDDDRWLRRHWERILSEAKWAYAAVEDAHGVLAAHSNPALVGRKLSGPWYERVVPDVAGDVVETHSPDLCEGRPAFDLRLPITLNGRQIGTYHSGLNANWFRETLAVTNKYTILRWGTVIAGIALVVLLAVGSLRLIARQTAALQRRLDEADLRRIKELSQFIIGVAHEVRNPLNAIRLNLHAIGRVHRGEAWLPDDEVAFILRESVREVDRVAALVREMLGYARQEPCRAEDVDLNAEVRGTLDFVKQSLEEDRVAVKVYLPSDAPRVRFDKTRLRQILLNLLRNAREAVGKGGRIEVGVSVSDGKLELAVADNGPGVPSEQRQRIFEPFYSTKDVGIGLGLALAKKFVEEGGGEIAYDPSHECGSRFVVRLPEAATSQEVRQ